MWTVFYLNFRGYMSKKSSFESIINSFDQKPNVIGVGESHYRHNKKVNLPGYQLYTRNRTEKSQGGIATLVLENDSKDCLKVTEGNQLNEFIITRHSEFKIPINVIHVYGQQQSRTPVNILSDHSNEIVEEIVKIEAKDEHVVWLGDFNCSLGSTIVKGNSDRVSHVGKLLLDFLESTEKYVLLNGSSKEIGGPFTRVEPTDPNDDTKKSILDLIIVSRDLLKYVDTFEIDNRRKYTPSHALKKNTLTYPDHLALILTFKDIPKKFSEPKKTPAPVIWNTNKKSG